MKSEIDNIIFEITHDCNLNCKHCYNIWKNDDNLRIDCHQTYSLALKAIKRIIKTTSIKSITFTGGESTISERFKEVVLFFRMRGLEVAIITNGNALKKKDYRELIQMGVGLFELTILSHDLQIHDNLTRKSGSWERTITSIREIIAMDGNVIGVIVITKKNYSKIEMILDLFNTLGVRTVMLNRFNIGGEGIKYIKEISLTESELNIAFTKANLFAEHNKIKLSSNVCTPWCFVNPDKYQNIEFVECSNSFFDKPITIDFLGNIRICNHSLITSA